MSRDREVVEAVRVETMDALMGGIETAYGKIGIDDPAFCIGGTRIALELLKRHGIFGRALKVHVLIYNRHAWDWQQAHPERSLLDALADIGMALSDPAEVPAALVAAGLPEQTRMRFCGFATQASNSFQLSSPGYLNGHVVAVLDLDDGKILLDTTAPQFTTPEFKIFLPSLAFDLDEEWARNPGSTYAVAEPEELNGGTIMYRQPNDLAGVYDASDWKQIGADPRFPGLLAAIDRKIEARLSLMRL